MDLLYKIKYLTKRTMLTIMGPAELDDHVDPVKRLDREKEERTGGKTDTKPSKEYPKKRKFDGDGSSASAKKAAAKKPAAKKAPAKNTAAKKAPAKKTTAVKPAEEAAEQKAAAKKTTSKARNQPGS